uniref:ATP-dependent DNA helicase n=1 Tax=Acrobeloides nanus TaxID=290746 RepID=A0A914EBK4_9BILA
MLSWLVGVYLLYLSAEILLNGNLVEEVFGPCLASNDFEAMKKHAIPCPFNSDVAKHNENVIAKIPNEYKIYHSFDSVKDQLEDGLHISSEYMTSLNSPDLPPHELKLKKNAIMMRLRNLRDNAIRGKIITEGAHYGREISIPRTKGLVPLFVD